MIEVTMRDGDQWITIHADTIDEAVRIIENYPTPIRFAIEGQTS